MRFENLIRFGRFWRKTYPKKLSHHPYWRSEDISRTINIVAQIIQLPVTKIITVEVAVPRMARRRRIVFLCKATIPLCNETQQATKVTIGMSPTSILTNELRAHGIPKTPNQPNPNTRITNPPAIMLVANDSTAGSVGRLFIFGPFHNAHQIVFLYQSNTTMAEQERSNHSHI